jgi:hypothetical protein
MTTPINQLAENVQDLHNKIERFERQWIAPKTLTLVSDTGTLSPNQVREILNRWKGFREFFLIDQISENPWKTRLIFITETVAYQAKKKLQPILCDYPHLYFQ